jgi:hypothetical protein
VLAMDVVEGETGRPGYLKYDDVVSAFSCVGLLLAAKVTYNGARWRGLNVSCVGEQELLNRMDAECIVQSLTLFPIEQACPSSIPNQYSIASVMLAGTLVCSSGLFYFYFAKILDLHGYG